MDDLPTPAATMDSATMMATSDVPKAATPKKAEKKGAQKDALPGALGQILTLGSPV